MSSEIKGITRELKTHIQILGSLVGFMWVLELINRLIFHGALVQFGIIPRSFIGLRGIFLAPFLHASIGHLLANTLPLIILGWLIMLRETKDFFTVSMITMIVSGLGVWLFAGVNTLHVGASGVIFGYLGYLLLRGYFERSVVSIFLSLIVGAVYGGLIWGVLPTIPGISWQGHLFGFMGGGIAARYLAKRKL